MFWILCCQIPAFDFLQLFFIFQNALTYLHRMQEMPTSFAAAGKLLKWVCLNFHQVFCICFPHQNGCSMCIPYFKAHPKYNIVVHIFHCILSISMIPVSSLYPLQMTGFKCLYIPSLVPHISSPIKPSFADDWFKCRWINLHMYIIYIYYIHYILMNVVKGPFFIPQRGFWHCRWRSRPNRPRRLQGKPCRCTEWEWERERREHGGKWPKIWFGEREGDMLVWDII